MIEVQAGSDSEAGECEDRADAVGVLAEEFIESYRQGLNPSIEDYCIRYPELATRIRDLFSTLLLVEHFEVSTARTSSCDSASKGAIPSRIGDFDIIREIGRGGMGIVYEAEQPSLGRRVALKVLPNSASLSPLTIERFRRESRAAARLHHSNIVPVFGVGEAEGLHYYVMQRIHGVGLDQVLAQLVETKLSESQKSVRVQRFARSLTGGEQLPKQVPTNAESDAIAGIAAGSSGGRSSHSEDRLYWNRVAQIGMQLANALDFAHAQGVLHRDVKPANVLLDSKDQVWLTDFGLAQATDDANLTHSGDIVGTLRYLAPERLKGQCSAQSDVYGLGITLYELLAYVPAFVETDRTKLIQLIAQQNPKRPRSINGTIPRDLETIVLKSIEKEVSRRYATAAELSEDLSRFLSDRPIRARRVVWLEQVWRWSRRNPAVAILAGIIGLLLLGLSFAWVTLHWVQTDRDQARIAERLAEEARIAANHAESNAVAKSYLAKAVGFRFSNRPGHKAKSLREIESAVQLNPPEEMVIALRNEAIASLNQTDVQFEILGSSWTTSSLRAVSFDRDFTLCAVREPLGSVVIRRMRDGTEINRIPSDIALGTFPRLSADGQLAFLHNAEAKTLCVWNITGNAKLLGPVDLRGEYCLDAEGKMLFVCQGDNAVHVYNLATGQETRRLVTSNPPHCVALSHAEDQLAIAFQDRTGVVQVVELKSGNVTTEFNSATAIENIAWHPHGGIVAMATGESFDAEVWDLTTKRKIRTLVGHEQDVTFLAFDSSGKYITSGSWDGTLRVWEWSSAKEVGALTGEFVTSAWDLDVVGTQLQANAIAVARVDRPSGLQTLTQFEPNRNSVDMQGDTSPDGRLLAVVSRQGLAFWDLENGKHLADIQQPGLLSLHLDWENQRLVGLGRATGLQVWPIVDRDTQWRVSSSVNLAQASPRTTSASRSADGTRWAWSDGKQAKVIADDGSVICTCTVPFMHDTVCLSPDGLFLATSGWHSPTINVWNVATGAVLKQLSGTHFPSFSPDSKHLITSVASEYQFWNLYDWQIDRRVARSDCSYPSTVAFSPRGDLLALELTSGTLHLLRTVDFSTVAVLECPQQNRPTRFSFCRSGQRLISYHHRKGEVHVWDIYDLQKHLAQMRLNWEDDEAIGNFDPSNFAEESRAGLTFPSTIEFIEPVESALQAAEKHFAEKPDSELAANNLAWQLLIGPQDSRDPPRALALLERAGSKISADPNSRNTLAVAYYRVGRFEEAIALLRQNLQGQEDAVLSYDLFFLAMCYWQVNEREHAHETLEWAERMLRISPPTDQQELWELGVFRSEARELINSGR